MSDTLTLTEVLRFVRSASREDIDALSPAIANRSAALRSMEMLQLVEKLQPGDKVRIKTNIKPKYMAGMVGKVVRLDPKHAKVDFGPGRHVQRFGRIVGVPYTSLEVID